MADNIYAVDWLELLPESLKQDKAILAMLGAMAEQKRKIAAEIYRLNIWPNFRNLSEEMMEVLRFDMDISFDEFQGDSEAKQLMLQMGRALKKNAGTISAVKEAIKTVYPAGGEITEWFDYGGDPYYFRANIDVTGQPTDAATLATIRSRILAAKNIRSWLDRIDLRTHAELSQKIYTGVVVSRQRNVSYSAIIGDVSTLYVLYDESDHALADENGFLLLES